MGVNSSVPSNVFTEKSAH